MPRPSVLRSATRVAFSPADRDAARAVTRALDEWRTLPTLVTDAGSSVRLTRGLTKVLRAAADAMAEGQAVTVLPSDAELTPAEAGELLGVSRPYVVRLLDNGTMPSERLPGSTHRRIRLADVLAYRANRESRPGR
ncbi:MAG: excisionase family DNA-binding protein [Haloechinothrix sp.]